MRFWLLVLLTACGGSSGDLDAGLIEDGGSALDARPWIDAPVSMIDGAHDDDAGVIDDDGGVIVIDDDGGPPEPCTLADVYTIADTPLFPEGGIFDPVDCVFYVGSLEDGNATHIDARDGTTSIYSDSPGSAWWTLGMVVDIPA